MPENKRLRLLVTGGSGQVGGELLQTLAPLGTVIAPSRAEMDLADPLSVRAFIRKANPHWIINAGAYTAVDKAESEPPLALTINAESVGVIAAEAKVLGGSVIHFSTDYVFNGEGTTPWIESDPTGPLGVYGASKLAGEQALLASGAKAFIFRTSWVYGATGKNFLRTILKLAREREELRIVNDQHGAPTWSRDLARLAAHIIASSVQGAIAAHWHLPRRRIWRDDLGRLGHRGDPPGPAARTAYEARHHRRHPKQRISNARRTSAEFAPRMQQARNHFQLEDDGLA